MRSNAQVRAAVPEDLEGLVPLCLEARAESTVGAELCTADAERLREQLATLMATPGGQILVGLVDDQIAGMLLGMLSGPSLFSQEVSLEVEALYVGVTGRRHGLGHALLAGALAVAEEAGATQIYAVHLPLARGVHRFFVRMGFAPASTHRVVSTQTLQRRLAGDPVRPGLGRRGPARGLEDLIARRRRVKKETQTGPVDLRGLQASLDLAEADQPAVRTSTSKHVRRAVASKRDSESSSTIS